MKQTAQSLKILILNHRDNIMQIALAIVVFLLGSWRLSEVGQPILFNDEYGYWADSAYLMGQDWSSVTSRIGYYSYGYSLMLIPLRYLARRFWWNWDTLYQSAVVLNAVMLAGSYLLSVRFCKYISLRFEKNINWIVRNLLCFAAIIYPSNLIYAHITWTENALTFVFCVFLFVLMRAVEKPTIWNHIGMAVVSIYLYTVHQRALAVPITAVIIVLYMKIRNHSQLRQTAIFMGSMFICISIHSIIKGGLQTDFYMGNMGTAQGLTNGWGSLLEKITRYIFNGKMLLLLAAGLLLLVLLYLLEKGKTWLVAGVALSGLAVGIAIIVFRGDAFVPDADTALRIANNDFAGQWGKIKGIFTKEGLERLIVSIIGKWFYLASATGLVICWGMWGLLKHGALMICKGIYQIGILLRMKALPAQEETMQKNVLAYRANDIWLFGVFLSWIGTFLIVAVYKEGFYKVDDLLHGRYNEFFIGILLIYSFYCLIRDKKWYITGGISLLLYLAAGGLCQHALNMQQNAVFELAHSTMLGRVFWNWESPEGKILQLGCYVLLFGALFIGLLKLGIKAAKRTKLPEDIVSIIIQGTALIVPVLVWLYLAAAIVDGYVIKRNDMQAYAMPQTAMWIGTLNIDAPVYFLEDTVHYRYAEGIQFMLQEQPITLTDMANVPLEEDVFFIMGTEYAHTAAVAEKCEVIYTSEVFSLLVNREGRLYEWWERMKRVNQ